MPYKAKATVFFNNNSYTCSIINLSRKGALLSSPVDAEPGNFLRLNLRLPGMAELIDLDAIMVRENDDKQDSWAVSFCQVSEKACRQLGEYIDGILTRHKERKVLEAQVKEEARQEVQVSEEKKTTKHKAVTSASVSASGDWQDWRSLQAAVSERMKKVTQKVKPALGPPPRPVERVAKREHDEFEESLGSLDDIYRDALKALVADKKRKR